MPSAMRLRDVKDQLNPTVMTVRDGSNSKQQTADGKAVVTFTPTPPGGGHSTAAAATAAAATTPTAPVAPANLVATLPVIAPPAPPLATAAPFAPAAPSAPPAAPEDIPKPTAAPLPDRGGGGMPGGFLRAFAAKKSTLKSVVKPPPAAGTAAAAAAANTGRVVYAVAPAAPDFAPGRMRTNTPPADKTPPSSLPLLRQNSKTPPVAPAAPPPGPPPITLTASAAAATAPTAPARTSIDSKHGGGAVRKWKTVEPDGGQNQHPKLHPSHYPAANISANSLVWTEASVTACVRSAEGSSGVIFVLNRGAIVVLKSNSSLGQEVFGTRIGQALGLTVPDMRCVGWTQKEHDLIHRAVMNRTPDDEKPGITRTLDRPFVGIMEFCSGVALESCTAQMAETLLTPTRMRQMGRLLLLDLIINNRDRIPLIWNNEGNAGNLMLVGANVKAAKLAAEAAFAGTKATATAAPVAGGLPSGPGMNAPITDERLVGIDNQAISFDPVKQAGVVTEYLGKIDSFIAEVSAKRENAPIWNRVSEFLMRWVPGFIVQPSHMKALYDGVVEGLATVRTITREQLVIIKKSVNDAVPAGSNWENVWGKMLALVHIDFYWAVIQQLQKLAVNLGVQPAQPATAAVSSPPPIRVSSPPPGAAAGADLKSPLPTPTAPAVQQTCTTARVALCQWPAAASSIAETSSLIDEHLRALTAANIKPDILVFSECWAESPDGITIDVNHQPFLRAMSSLAAQHRVILILGSITECGVGEYDRLQYTTTVLIDENGRLIGSYRKQGANKSDPYHGYGTTPGIFNTRFGKIAVLICLDIEKPDVLTATLKHDPVLIFNPSFIPPPSVGDEKYPEIIRSGWRTAMDLMARRFEQLCYKHQVTIIRVDSSAGKGSSIVVSPYQTINAPHPKHTTLITKIAIRNETAAQTPSADAAVATAAVSAASLDTNHFGAMRVSDQSRMQTFDNTGSRYLLRPLPVGLYAPVASINQISENIPRFAASATATGATSSTAASTAAATATATATAAAPDAKLDSKSAPAPAPAAAADMKSPFSLPPDALIPFSRASGSSGCGSIASGGSYKDVFFHFPGSTRVDLYCSDLNAVVATLPHPAPIRRIVSIPAVIPHNHNNATAPPVVTASSDGKRVATAAAAITVAHNVLPLRVATLATDGVVRVWSVVLPKAAFVKTPQVVTALATFPTSPTAAAAKPVVTTLCALTNTAIAVGYGDGTIELIDLGTLQATARVGGGCGRISVLYSPSHPHSLLVSGSMDGTIAVWDVRDIAQPKALATHAFASIRDQEITALAVAEDRAASRLLFGTANGSFGIVSLTAFIKPQTAQSSSGAAAALRPTIVQLPRSVTAIRALDATTFVTACTDTNLHLWRCPTVQAVLSQSAIAAAAGSPKPAAAAGEVEPTPQLKHIITSHQFPVYDIAVGRDKLGVLTTLWSVSSCEVLQHAFSYNKQPVSVASLMP